MEGKSQKEMYSNRCIPHLRVYLRRGMIGARSWEAGPGWSRQVRGVGEHYQIREARLRPSPIVCSLPTQSSRYSETRGLLWMEKREPNKRQLKASDPGERRESGLQSQACLTSCPFPLGRLNQSSFLVSSMLLPLSAFEKTIPWLILQQEKGFVSWKRRGHVVQRNQCLVFRILEVQSHTINTFWWLLIPWLNSRKNGCPITYQLGGESGTSSVGKLPILDSWNLFLESFIP